MRKFLILIFIMLLLTSCGRDPIAALQETYKSGDYTTAMNDAAALLPQYPPDSEEYKAIFKIHRDADANLGRIAAEEYMLSIGVNPYLCQ